MNSDKLSQIELICIRCTHKCITTQTLRKLEYQNCKKIISVLYIVLFVKPINHMLLQFHMIRSTYSNFIIYGYRIQQVLYQHELKFQISKLPQITKVLPTDLHVFVSARTNQNYKCTSFLTKEIIQTVVVPTTHIFLFYIQKISFYFGIYIICYVALQDSCKCNIPSIILLNYRTGCVLFFFSTTKFQIIMLMSKQPKKLLLPNNF